MADGLTVLVAEDDPQVREVGCQTLERHGYQLLVAADGAAALEVLADHSPDLAVLDMMLPGPSGFQVAQALREQSGGRVFVVMMSGNASPAHRDYAFAAGVDRFLAKPFSMSKLLEVLEGARRAAPTARINTAGIMARAAVPA
jgi:two-component system KDP operon response regulator KdpE